MKKIRSPSTSKILRRNLKNPLSHRRFKRRSRAYNGKTLSPKSLRDPELNKTILSSSKVKFPNLSIWVDTSQDRVKEMTLRFMLSNSYPTIPNSSIPSKCLSSQVWPNPTTEINPSSRTSSLKPPRNLQASSNLRRAFSSSSSLWKAFKKKQVRNRLWSRAKKTTRAFKMMSRVKRTQRKEKVQSRRQPRWHRWK